MPSKCSSELHTRRPIHFDKTLKEEQVSTGQTLHSVGLLENFQGLIAERHRSNSWQEGHQQLHWTEKDCQIKLSNDSFNL